MTPTMRLLLYCVVALTTWVVLVLGEFKAPEGKSLYGHTEYHKKGKKCYQCAWSPPKLAYATLKTSNYQSQLSDYGQPSHTSLYYSAKKVPVKVQGGWDKCYDTFTQRQAGTYGIDQWECEHNCYTRTDKNGNLYRGCYKGEYNVNPHKLGCHVQAGSQYCFCAGELCNNRQSPEFKGHTKSPAYSGKRSYKDDFNTHDYDFKHKGYGMPESYDRKGYNKYDENREYDKYDKHDKYDKYDLYGDRYDKKYGYDKYDKYENDLGLDKKHRYDSYGKDDGKDIDYGYDYNKKYSKKSYNVIHDKYDNDKYGNGKYGDNEYDRRDSHRRGYDRHSSKHEYKYISSRYGYGKHDSHKHDYDKHDSHKHDYEKHDSHKHDYDKHDSHKHDYDKHDSHKHDYEKHDSHKHDYDKHDSHRQHYDKHDSREYGSGKHGKHSYGKHGYGRPDQHDYDSHGSDITKSPWNTVNLHTHSSYRKPNKHGYKHRKRGSRRRSRNYKKHSDQDYSHSVYGHHKHSTKKPTHSVYPKHGYEKHRPQRYPAAPHHDNHHYRGDRGHH